MRRFSRDDEEAGATEAFEDAALYDFEYRRRRADVNFYRRLAAEQGGPILDLACGTGRLMIPLLRDGHTVVGLDRSTAMLGRAAARVARLARVRRRRALLLRADLRAFAFRRRFALAVCAFHSLQHLVDDAALVGFLRAVGRSLEPGGWLAFDVLPPDGRWLGRDPERRWGRTVFRHPVTRERLVYTTNHRLDPRRQALHMRVYYAPIDAAGRAIGPERVVRLCHRQLEPTDVERLATRTGFAIAARWAGFDGRPLRPAEPADEHIYLLRRKRLAFRLTPIGPPVPSGSTNNPNHRRRAVDMAEKVARLGITREKDYMYYVKDGGVWKVARKQPGVPKGRPEKVADGGFEMDNNYIYFVDKDGDAARAKRAVGGQKRKKSARKAAKKAKKSKKGGKKKGKKRRR